MFDIMFEIYLTYTELPLPLKHLVTVIGEIFSSQCFERVHEGCTFLFVTRPHAPCVPVCEVGE